MGFNFLNVGLVALLNTGVEWATALTDWLSRKPITINGAAKTPDLTDPFSSDNFTDFGTLFDVSGGALNWQMTNTATPSGTYRDVGLLSNDRWKIRFKLALDNNTNSTGNGQLIYFVMSDNTTGAQSTAQDSLGISMANYNAINTQIWAGVSDGAGLDTSETGKFLLATGGTLKTVWLDMTRLSPTKFQITMYADSEYTEVLNTQTRTIVSTIIGLQYFKVCNHDTSNTFNGTVDGTIDDLEIYNNVTVVQNIPSQQTVSDSDVYSTTGAWTKLGTEVTVDDGLAGKVYWNDADGGVDTRVHRSLSESITGNFVAHIDYKFTARTGNGNSWLLALTDDTDEPTSSGSGNQAGIQHFAGTIGVNDGAGLATTRYTVTAGVQYYLTLTKEDSTHLRLQVFTDVNRTVKVFDHNETIVTLATLAHVQHATNSAAGGTERITQECDNLKIWKDITEVNPSTLDDYAIPILIENDADLQRKTAEDFEDQFDGYANQTAADAVWIPQDTAKARVNLTTERIDFDFEDNSGDDDSISTDLTSVSDTKWCLDFTINWSTIDANSRCWFGLSSDSSDQATAKDFIGMLVHNFSSVSNFETADTDGATLPYAGDNSSTIGAELNRDYFIRIIRTSATTYSILIFSDKARTLELERVEGTCASTTNSLRYILFTNRNDFNSTNNQVGTIRDVHFWDGITNPVTQETPTYEDDFSGTDDWTDSGTTILVNTGTDVIDWDNSTTDDGTWIDLGLILDSKICMRTEFNITSLGSSTGNHWLGIVLSDVSGVTLATTQHFAGFGLNTFNGADVIKSQFGDGVALSGGTYNNILVSPSTTTYYVETIINGTQLINRIYSDSDYSILVANSTDTISVENLRYLKVHGWEITASGKIGTGTIPKISLWNGITSPNASGRKIVFTDNAFDGSAVEYSSVNKWYDPINGSGEWDVRIPSVTTGTDFDIQMYCDYTPSANPSYVPELAVTTLVESDLDVYNQTGGWAGGITLYGAGNTRTGIRVEASSPALGKIITKVTGELTQTLSPTGTYKWTIRNDADAIVAETETGDASTLTEATTETVETFTFDVPRVLQEGDRIQLEYSGGDASNTVNLSYNNALPAMPTGFKRCEYNGSYTDTTTGTPFFVLLETKTREQSVWDNNFKGVYSQKNNSLIDSTVNEEDFTKSGTPEISTINDKQMLDFDGSTDYFTEGTTNYYDYLTSTRIFTQEFWMVMDAQGTITIFDNCDRATQTGFSFANAGSNISWGIRNAGASWDVTLDIPQADIVIGERNLITIKADGTNFSIYLNGILKDTGTSTTARTPTYPTVIGRMSNSGNEDFNGQLEGIRFSNVKRSTPETIARYNAEKENSDFVTTGTEVTQ